jgi:hypothetical protein
MTKALLLVPLFAAACVAAPDDDLTLDDTTSALTGDQIAAMNDAAAGTGITYSAPLAHTLVQALPPDPLFGDAVRLGPATTAWAPPDPCLPPDPCRTKFDIAGANFRVVGAGIENRDGAFVINVRITDAAGHVVFDSAR